MIPARFQKKPGPAHAEPTIKLDVLTITPEYAAELLERNTNNRPLRPTRVGTYKRAMLAGKWKLSADTIKLDKDMNLIDGQHRLQACVESGVTITTAVAYDVDPDVFDVIDTGGYRSMGDTLALRGEHNCIALGSALSWARKYDLGKGGGHGLDSLSTTTELMAYLEANPGIRESMAWPVGKKILRMCGSTGVVAASHYIFSRISKPDADIFMENLATGAGLDQDDPAWILRERLLKSRGAVPELRLRKYSDNAVRSRDRLTSVEIFALIIVAWNAWRKRRRIKHIRWTSKEEFPIAI